MLPAFIISARRLAASLLVFTIVAACGVVRHALPSAHGRPATRAATPRPLSAPTTGPTPTHRVTFSTPGFPADAVLADGGVWVVTHRDQTVFELDPGSNRVLHTVMTNDGGGTWISFSAGKLWVSTGDSGIGHTVEVDPRSGRELREVPGYTDLVAGGSRWGIEYDDLVRRDPRTGVVLRRFHNLVPDPNVSQLTRAYAGAVWLSTQTDAVRVSVVTNKVTVIPLPGARTSPKSSQGYACGAQMAFIGGKAWLANPAGLYAIDLKTNHARRVPGVVIGDLDQWGDIAVTQGAGSVWVRTSGSVVTRLDARTERVTARYPATGGGGGMLVADGSLWVTNALNDVTWREPIK